MALYLNAKLESKWLDPVPGHRLLDSDCRPWQFGFQKLHQILIGAEPANEEQRLRISDEPF